MKYPLYVVTGAPGSGKSKTAESLIHLNSDCLAFDIDWLATAASNLAQKDIFSDSSTWNPYNNLWFEILHSVYKNQKIPVLFAPIHPKTIERNGQPDWCSHFNWLLLDCNDEIRRKRLTQRIKWTDSMITEALDDARSLRQVIPSNIDTSAQLPDAVASEILDWVNRTETTAKQET